MAKIALRELQVTVPRTSLTTDALQNLQYLQDFTIEKEETRLRGELMGL
jgi:hypothetical protein